MAERRVCDLEREAMTPRRGRGDRPHREGRAARDVAAVVLVLVGGLAFFAIVFYAPPDARELPLGGNGLLATLVGIWIRSPRDSSG